MKLHGKYKSLSIADKMKVLDRFDTNVKIKNIKEEFNVNHSTVYDIKMAMPKLLQFHTKHHDLEEGTSKRKRTRNPKYQELDDAVWKWYLQ